MLLCLRSYSEQIGPFVTSDISSGALLLTTHIYQGIVSKSWNSIVMTAQLKTCFCTTLCYLYVDIRVLSISVMHTHTCIHIHWNTYSFTTKLLLSATSCLPGQSLQLHIEIDHWPHPGCKTCQSSYLANQRHIVTCIDPIKLDQACQLIWPSTQLSWCVIVQNVHPHLESPSLPCCVTHTRHTVEAMSERLTQTPLEKTWVPWMKSRLSQRRGCEC